MKRVKMIAVLYIAATMIATFTGCINDKPESKASKAPVRLSIVMPDGGRVYKPDNVVIRELEKRTNTKLDINMIPQLEFYNKFSVMVASGTLPDIVKTYNYDFYNFISQNTFMDITKFISDYGVNMKEKIPQTAWDRIQYDGKYYGVPYYNWPGKMNMVVRKDWLDRLGLALPANIDELREMYIRFTYDDPDGNGEKDTYGLTTASEISWEQTPDTLVPIFGAFGIMPGYFYAQDGMTYPASISPEYKEALAFLAKLYTQDKVVDPDLFIVQADQAARYIVQGRGGAFTAWWSVLPRKLMVQLKMKEESPQAEWAIVPPITGPAGKNGLRASSMVNGVASISSKCQDPVEAIKLLDYLVSDEGAKLVNFGIKDIHYIEEKGQSPKRTLEGQKAMDEKWIDAMSPVVGRADIISDAYRVNDPDSWKHIEAARDSKLYFNLFEGYATLETQKYMQGIKKFELEWLVKFVTGKVSIEKYDEYVQGWLNIGGREVLRSLTEEYNKHTNAKLKPAYQ